MLVEFFMSKQVEKVSVILEGDLAEEVKWAPTRFQACKNKTKAAWK